MREKVVGESFRAADSHTCLLIGSKHSVCTTTFPGSFMTRVTKGSWNPSTQGQCQNPL